MFYIPRKRMTIESLWKASKEYRAIRHFLAIAKPYVQQHEELHKTLMIKSDYSLLNIIRNYENRLVISKKFDGIWFHGDDLRTHISVIGTTGSGKSIFSNCISFMNDGTNESNYVAAKIDHNQEHGFSFLPISNTTDCDLVVQYKGNEMFIFMKFDKQKYFVELYYNKKTLVSFTSPFNQSIDIISNNIRFLLSATLHDKDYREILEQDISTADKIILADMLNI